MDPSSKHTKGLRGRPSTTVRASRQASSGPEKRSPEAFLNEIREQIGKSRIPEARSLAEEAARCHPHNCEVRKIHRILNESSSRTRPATGRDMHEDYEWLRDPPAEYRGKWVALIGRDVVGSAATLKELLACLPSDLEQTPLTVQIAP